ncbi:hypothetical protein BBK82_24640 [Lentzea guizhouensis]|uniref:TIR domain-containing protein n=1 Tax=Lentzea guizhouensis TaxID=1586287 RepID=A0A1B2HM30_9PSEU|nr:TIR domain-containing protein [Lentzea guizhouensis]ANZ38779.1 hypothetical protein BBK82_24640 [Lentzea guizhouensis]
MTEYDFDVAPSFAEQDRALVLPVVQRLKELGVSVYYDEDRLVETWGLDLVEHLSDTYGERVRFVLLFASHNYVEHKWARLQRRAAQARALEQQVEYVLPVKIDDTAVPGLSETIGYLDLRRHDTETIARAVVQKLAQHRSEFTPQTPITAQAVQALTAERPKGWEYLLYVGVVWQGMRTLDSKYWEHFLRYAPRNGHVEHGTGLDAVRDRNVLLGEIIAVAVDTIFTPHAQEAAFGAGNADRIIHLGRLFVQTYDEILEWARTIYATSYADAHARVAARIQARFADQQLEAMHKVAQDLREVADTLVERLTAGEQINVNVPLVFEVDPDLEAEFVIAVGKLSG